MLRATASFSQPHPDIVGYMAGVAALEYSISRRRFVLDFPGETPPPEILPPSGDWVNDYIDLYIQDSKSMQAILDKGRQKS